MGLIGRLLTRKSSPSAQRSEIDADASIRSIVEAATELVAASRHDAALRLVDTELTRQPGHAQLLFVRGSVLSEMGRAWEARRDLLEAERLGWRDATLELQVGWLELRAGHLDAAERRMADGVRDTEDWRAHFGLASVWSARRHWSAARECYLRALRAAPANIDCLLALVSCAIGESRFDEAEACARRAISEHPSSRAAWASLGIALLWQDRFGEAATAFVRAHECGSEFDSSIPVMDAGIAMRDGGKVDEAIEFYRHLLPTHPDLNVHAHYAYSLLKAGRLREGWEQNEFRWMFEPLRALLPRTPIPVWTGQYVRGKSVLITAEQGIGDVIQFIRFARPLKSLGAMVFVLLRKRMREIIEGMPGVDAVFDSGDALPAIDFRVPVMSLPRAFGTDLESIPSEVPYVPLKPELVDLWRREIASDAALNVGIVWSGDPIGLRNRYKSIPLRLLASLGSIPGVRLHSLQKGEAAADVGKLPLEPPIVDLSPKIRDLADTAAIIDSLDLVITICTSVAHLAGALGKPVWTLLSEPADWRWMQDRTDTPWYPTMRLFRQKRQGDWGGVIDDVSQALTAVARDRSRLSDSTPASTSAGCDPTEIPTEVPPDQASVDAICHAAAARYGILQFRRDGSAASRSMEWYGEYRQRQLAFFCTLIEPGMIVVDVASGSGFDSTALASAVGEAGHLFLLESRPAHLAVLANNLSANGVSNATIIQQRWSHDSIFQAPEADSGLDTLCLPRFHLLRINEDANAVRTLTGARSCLWDFRPAIMIVTAGEDAMGAAEACVADFGYHSMRVDFSLFDNENFNRRPNDIFDARVGMALFALPEELDLQLPQSRWQQISSPLQGGRRVKARG